MKTLGLFLKFIGLSLSICGVYVVFVYQNERLYFSLGLGLIIIGLSMSIVGFVLEVIKPKQVPIIEEETYRCPMCHETYETSQKYCIQCGHTFKEEDII